MQIQTNLKPMFSYSPYIIIIIIIIIIATYTYIKEKRKKEIPTHIIIPNNKDITNIKKKYLKELQELNNNLQSNTITNRKAYQKLSNIIRNFIYEVTNIKTQNYTLKEIKKINIPILYELVNEYYNPEFAKISKGNITISIEKTRMVIEKWN